MSVSIGTYVPLFYHGPRTTCAVQYIAPCVTSKLCRFCHSKSGLNSTIAGAVASFCSRFFGCESHPVHQSIRTIISGIRIQTFVTLFALGLTLALFCWLCLSLRTVQAYHFPPSASLQRASIKDLKVSVKVEELVEE